MTFILFLFLSIARAEQVHAPTIYLEKTPPAPAKKPKVLGPVLLDARTPFDFAMGHLPQAISIRWQDYSQTQEPHKGALDPDVSLLSRKLRFLGINPDREVIVLGLGPKGNGEDGRIAWMLDYLGIKKVKVQNIQNVPGRQTTEDLAQNESVPPWNPKLKSSLRITKSDLSKLISKPGVQNTLLDVRPSDDFAKGHIPGALNIPWTRFSNDQGDPLDATRVRDVLAKNKIDLNTQLIIYSSDGVASGYVAFLTDQAGLRVSHYDGSFSEWSADPKAPVEQGLTQVK